MGGDKSLDAPAATDALHEEVEQGAKQYADKEADKDVAYMMDT